MSSPWSVRCAHQSMWEIEKCLPNPRNANKHTPEQIERLAKIIAAQGWRHPVVISKRSGLVVAGHARLLAAQSLGQLHVPVDFQDFDSDASEYAFLIADNAIAEFYSHTDVAQVNADLIELGFLPEMLDLDLLGIRDLNSDQTVAINRGDENSEWVSGTDLPEFQPGGKYINLIFQFKTEEAREAYCRENNIEITHKHSNQWIVHK